MAKIVLGMGMSHGPMLSTPPDQWHQRVVADRGRRHAFRGGDHSFDELVGLRAGEHLARHCTVESNARRHAACRAALEALAGSWDEVRPDCAIIVGNDQMELFSPDNQPALAIHHGEILENLPYTGQQIARLAPGLAIAEHGHHGPRAETFPGHPGLALHLIGKLLEDGFDPAALQRLPDNPGSYSSGLPHAYGFVYRQVIREHVVPVVPVFLNTFYPPNQPPVGRCIALGRSIARAVAAWDADLRVAVVASGGLSHFVVDELLDRRFLQALQQRSLADIAAIPEYEFRAGSSEIKNWVPVAAAAMEAGLEPTQMVYEPCYRSEAGTGSGMGFVCWR